MTADADQFYIGPKHLESASRSLATWAEEAAAAGGIARALARTAFIPTRSSSTGMPSEPSWTLTGRWRRCPPLC